MATLGNAGRVGAVAVAASALFGAMYVFLHGSLSNAHTYTMDVIFDNARGVTAETPVTLAGVQIGKVETVRLTPDQKADLKLQIKEKLNGQDVHIPLGSRFTINTPLLGTTGTILVVPPPNSARLAPIREGAILKGDNSGDLTASFDKATTLLDQATLTTKKVNLLLDSANNAANDPKIHGTLIKTLDNVNAASENGLQLTNHLNNLLLEDNAQVKLLLNQTRVGTQVSLDNISQTTTMIRDTTRENKSQINAIVRNLNDTTSAVAGITGQANTALKSGITENLSASVANLKSTTDKLNTIAGSFQSLTTDPKVQGNLRETIANIRDSSEQAKFLIERLNKLAGGRKKTAAIVIGPGGATVIVPEIPEMPGVKASPSQGAPFYAPRVDLLLNTRTNHFRTDLDAVVPLGVSPVSFARAGVYGFGDSNKLILQAGQGIGKSGLLDARVGLYASKLSIGGDYGLGRPVTFSFDLYDPNNFHLDARSVIKLAPEIALVLGGEDLNRHGGGLIGLEYRQSR